MLGIVLEPKQEEGLCLQVGPLPRATSHFFLPAPSFQGLEPTWRSSGQGSSFWERAVLGEQNGTHMGVFASARSPDSTGP